MCIYFFSSFFFFSCVLSQVILDMSCNMWARDVTQGMALGKDPLSSFLRRTRFASAAALTSLPFTPLHDSLHVDRVAAVLRFLEPMFRQKFTRLRLIAGLCHVCRSHTACVHRIVDIGGQAFVFRVAIVHT